MVSPTTRWIPVRPVLERACAIVTVGSSYASLNSYMELVSVLTSTWRLGRRSSRYYKPEILIMRHYSVQRFICNVTQRTWLGLQIV